MALGIIKRTAVCSREIDIERLDVVRIFALQSFELILHADVDITDLDSFLVLFLELNDLLLSLVDPEKLLVCFIIKIKAHIGNDVLKGFYPVHRERSDPV